MVKPTDPKSQVASLLARAAALSATAAEAAAAGNVDEALLLEERAEGLRRRARKAAQAQSVVPQPDQGDRGVLGSWVEATMPARDIAISALNELEVPSAPKAVSDYAAVRFGTNLDSRAMASLRRDEQRSWRSARSVRAVYVVPALEGHRFLPLRGKVALSSWPLRMRLIGPWSERADHLRATRNIARQTTWLSDKRPELAGRMASLLFLYARTIPGMAGDGPSDVERAASEELAQIEEADLEWRAEAEERAKAVLDEAGYLWGAAPPRAVAQKVG